MKLNQLIPTFAMLAASPLAFSQSSVSISGIADACIAVTNGTTGANTQMNSGCYAGSRLIFRGQEDLGGGLSANFSLENGFGIDSGSIAQGGRFFGRRAVVGLKGGFGEVHLGRDYTPTFYLIAPIDPFSLGIGTAGTTTSTAARGTGGGRNDNSILYTSPTSSGFSIKAQYAFGESTTVAKKADDAMGLMVMYRAGKLIAGAAINSQTNLTDTASDKVTTIAASYDMGFIKPAFIYQSGQFEGTRTVATPSVANSAFSRDYQSYVIGATMPFGPKGSNLIVSHKVTDDKTRLNFDGTQTTVGYKHALSPRTYLYTAYSQIKNKNKSAFSIADATTTYTTAAGSTSPSVFWAGVQHNF